MNHQKVKKNAGQCHVALKLSKPPVPNDLNFMMYLAAFFPIKLLYSSSVITGEGVDVGDGCTELELPSDKVDPQYLQNLEPSLICFPHSGQNIFGLPFL